MATKDRLFEEALQLYVDHAIATLTETLHSKGSPLAGVRAVLDMMEEKSRQDGGCGCLCGNSSAELAKSHPGVARVITGFYGRFVSTFTTAIQNAIDAGELPPKTDAARWASLFLAVTQGLSNMVQGGYDMTAVRTLMDGLIAELEGT